MINYGIALCRVSTSKQKLEGNSLSAQETRINQVAADLFQCQIVKTWSLDVSSRKGKNFKRKDLSEMLAYCKQHKKVKYLFVDEHDRYMRSVDEYYMWKGRFLYEAGVTLVIATKPELTLSPDSASMAIEFFGVWQGETNNEDRIKKTTDKMQARIAAGYFPSNVHTGYQKTDVPGLHEPLEPQWSLLQTVMKKIIYQDYTLHQGLNWLIDQQFVFGKGGKFDLNRFKRILVDPYYAGITKVSTWEVTGEGLHKAMISKEEHEQLKDIVSGVKRKFVKQKHNPNFPMSNLVMCKSCQEKNQKYGKLVGYRNHNGKRPEVRKYYERYMCRVCKLGLTKEDLHEQITALLVSMRISNEERNELKKAIHFVWEQRQKENVGRNDRLQDKLEKLNSEKDALVRSIGAIPEIAAEIAESVSMIKNEIMIIQNEISSTEDSDKYFLSFVEFSLNYVDDLNANWWDLTPERRQRCEQLLFPKGIYLTKEKSVSTPQISDIYRYITMKKTSKGSKFSLQH